MVKSADLPQLWLRCENCGFRFMSKRWRSNCPHCDPYDGVRWLAYGGAIGVACACLMHIASWLL